MYEGKYIQPCTPELALEVGLNLRYEDRREAEETSGLCAEASIIESYYNSTFTVYFKVPNGKAAGVAGVTPHNVIWMLCTEASTQEYNTLLSQYAADSQAYNSVIAAPMAPVAEFKTVRPVKMAAPNL